MNISDLTEAQLISEIDYRTGLYRQLVRTIEENKKTLEIVKQNADRWVVETAEGSYNREFMLKNDPDNMNKHRIGMHVSNLNTNLDKLKTYAKEIREFALLLPG